ncbi:MAG: ThuA domain-containing protein [Bryobacteraceae bacterium]
MTIRRRDILGLLTMGPAPMLAATKRKALLIDGQNNHDWKTTTPYLKRYLEETGMFAVDVATTPAKGGDMTAFRPKFKGYAIVVLNYNGEDWTKETERDFTAYVKGGGGVVVVHAANNAFPTWPEFNEMIGIGGWGGRTEKSGPYMRLRDGKWTMDMTPGRGGHHGKQHEYKMTLRDEEHPITQGLPKEWMHAQDELYDNLRGPAKNVRVLATAFSDPSTGGNGEHEPLLMVLPYGKGRIFHTAIGHAAPAIQSVDFIVTYQRGSEWAATGKVTQRLPADFPPPDKVSQRVP